MNNVFIQYPALPLDIVEHKPNLKLVLGLVLGLGFPVTVGMIVAYGLWNLRRKSRRDAMSGIQRLKNGGVITESERSRSN